MATYQIVTNTHRGIVGVVCAGSPREALKQHVRDSGFTGVRYSGTKMQHEGRTYQAVKV